MEWIDSAKKLPKHGVQVLLCIKETRSVCIGVIKDRMWHRSGYAPVHKPVVTHWMPLPEPPDEG